MELAQVLDVCGVRLVALWRARGLSAAHVGALVQTKLEVEGDCVRLFAPRETCVYTREFVHFPALGKAINAIVGSASNWAHSELRDGVLLRSGYKKNVQTPQFSALATCALVFPRPPGPIVLAPAPLHEDDDA